ncbi:unnamed protein product [Protopolystoma xenopodis]|uniref:Uncharacterized protein n=1 Tax=Protopolystoma xenopodis TaxID=117903 RepID=A0A448XKK8_9PLAT|nr:unnamed protein product [Protopolystoma xenopodis]
MTFHRHWTNFVELVFLLHANDHLQHRSLCPVKSMNNLGTLAASSVIPQVILDIVAGCTPWLRLCLSLCTPPRHLSACGRLTSDVVSEATGDTAPRNLPSRDVYKYTFRLHTSSRLTHFRHVNNHLFPSLRPLVVLRQSQSHIKTLGKRTRQPSFASYLHPGCKPGEWDCDVAESWYTSKVGVGLALSDQVAQTL